MEKSKLLIVGALIFAVGLGAGYLVSRYAFNTQLSQSEAMVADGGTCSGCIDADGDPAACASSCTASEGNCKSICGGIWTSSVASRPSPSSIKILPQKK